MQRLAKVWCFAVFAMFALALAVAVGCSVPVEGTEEDGNNVASDGAVAGDDTTTGDDVTADDDDVNDDDGSTTEDVAPDDDTTDDDTDPTEDGGDDVTPDDDVEDDEWEEAEGVPFVPVDENGTAELPGCIDDGTARATSLLLPCTVISPHQRSLALVTMVIGNREPIPFFEITPDLEGPWLESEGIGSVDYCVEHTTAEVWLVNGSDDPVMIRNFSVWEDCSDELGGEEGLLWGYENGYPVIGQHQRINLGYLDQYGTESVFHPACIVHLEDLEN